MTGRPPAVDAAWPGSSGEALAGIISAARGTSVPGAAEALASLSAARRLASDLERGEQALIEAARGGGATWSQISAALGTRNRQTAQKRHADLARRCPRPPKVDNPAAEGDPLANAERPRPGPGTRKQATVPAPGKAATARRRRPAVPRIMDAIIAGGHYELVRAPDYAETRAWQVLVGGRLAGIVRPTWRGERSRPGWEPVTTDGTVLPVKGTGRVTPAGNARVRDAAAVSLLRALQQEQEGTANGTRPSSRRTLARHQEKQ